MRGVGKERRNMDYRRVIEKLNPIDDIFLEKWQKIKAFVRRYLESF